MFRKRDYSTFIGRMSDGEYVPLPQLPRAQMEHAICECLAFLARIEKGARRLLAFTAAMRGQKVVVSLDPPGLDKSSIRYDPATFFVLSEAGKRICVADLRSDELLEHTGRAFIACELAETVLSSQVASTISGVSFDSDQNWRTSCPPATIGPKLQISLARAKVLPELNSFDRTINWNRFRRLPEEMQHEVLSTIGMFEDQESFPAKRSCFERGASEVSRLGLYSVFAEMMDKVAGPTLGRM